MEMEQETGSGFIICAEPKTPIYEFYRSIYDYQEKFNFKIIS